jgi:hypothetical protein
VGSPAYQRKVPGFRSASSNQWARRCSSPSLSLMAATAPGPAQRRTGRGCECQERPRETAIHRDCGVQDGRAIKVVAGEASA